jgi:hypothetical protein
MIKITPSQVASELKSLFDCNIPTRVRCQAVLGGGNAGRIFVDDLRHPNMGYVWEQDEGLLNRGGLEDWHSLTQILEMLRQESTVALGSRDGDLCMDQFQPNPDAGAECVELKRPIKGSDLSTYFRLPQGFEVFRMGKDLVEKSPQLDLTLLRYGNIDNFLQTALGVCIMHGDEYVCQVSADMDFGGMREVGLVTELNNRKQGLGTITVAHLLNWCDELGCAASWDCVKLNIGPLKIALSLAFRTRGDISYWDGSHQIEM